MRRDMSRRSRAARWAGGRRVVATDPGKDRPPGFHRGTPAPSPAWPDGRGAHSHRHAARARAERLRAPGLLAPLVGTLRLQALGASAATVAERRPARASGAGENAGVLDLGDGLAVAFKVESHNHPSVVEPFQGAATGVGGILRDISGDGPEAGRPARRAPASAPPTTISRAPWAGSATTGTASACRRSAARSSSTRRTPPTASSTRCAWGCCPRARHARGSDDARRPRPPLRGDNGTRRHRRRLGARERGARRGGRRQAPDRPGRRPVHGEAADRSVGRAGRAPSGPAPPGWRGRGPCILALRDGVRRRNRRPPGPRAPA